MSTVKRVFEYYEQPWLLFQRVAWDFECSLSLALRLSLVSVLFVFVVTRRCFEGIRKEDKLKIGNPSESITFRLSASSVIPLLPSRLCIFFFLLASRCSKTDLCASLDLFVCRSEKAPRFSRSLHSNPRRLRGLNKKSLATFR